MKRRSMIGDQWSDAWPGDFYAPETIEVETDEREDTHFQLLGPDGERIAKPVMRVGFHPRSRQ